MKRIVCLIIACILVIALAGCGGDPSRHEGEAKTPSGSTVQKGKDYKEVIKDFEESGFKNIKTEKIEDLILGWLTKDGEVESVSVDGNEDYSPNVWYPNDVEVLITYHTFPEKDKSSEVTVSNEIEKQVSQQNNFDEVEKEALESIFPVENAKRAAVVAITNYYATDVYGKDGNTFDVSKFHSYSDTSGNFFNYLMYVNSPGEWSVKDNQTWHVDSLKLENSFGVDIEAFMDISYDGNKYNISNIAGKFDKDVDLSEMEAGEDASLFLTIPTELIESDRNQTVSHHSWLSQQFSSWDGSHKKLKELIIKNLNDEKSFKHIETTYQLIFNEEIRDEINDIFKSLNRGERVEIGDLWITTRFSAKNAFNATVKNTAYGISSYSDNTVTLVLIE